MADKTSEPTAKDLKFVKELMGLLEESGLTEIDFQKGDLAISLSKAKAASAVQHVMAPAMTAPAATPAAAAPSQPVATKESPADRGTSRRSKIPHGRYSLHTSFPRRGHFCECRR